MKFEYFIAKRIAFSKFPSFAKWIIRIATTAIALSLAIMIITTAIITGFKNQITEKIFGFWGHIHITDTNINRTFEPKAILADQDYLFDLKSLKSVEYKKINYDFDKSMDPIEEIIPIKSQIQNIQSFAITPGIIKTGQDLEGILLKGIGKDFDTTSIMNFIEEGRPIQFLDSTASRDLIISTETARRLNISLGDNLRIYFVKERDQMVRRFEVTGIYKTGLEEYDKKFALVDMRMVQDVLGWDDNQIGGYEIFLNNMEDMELFNEYIYMEILPANLYSETIRTKFPSIFEWLELQNINEDVILLLMIIVSVINMVTALLILILERTHMIGTLKSLGSTNWGIRKIFLYHAAYIIGRGMIIGNIIALSICFLQAKFGFITLDEKSYYLSTAPIELQLESFLLINFFVFLTTLCFLILPTYVITKIDPIKALRFD
jgi:lipoprotein-releasing system permease protein